VRRAIWCLHIAAFVLAALFLAAVLAGHDHPFVYDVIGGSSAIGLLYLVPIAVCLYLYSWIRTRLLLTLREKSAIAAIELLLVPAWLNSLLTGIGATWWALDALFGVF